MVKRILGRLRWVCITGAFLLLITAGVLAYFRPSPSLLLHGGYMVVIPWGVFCILGGVLGIVGAVRKTAVLEMLGAALGASASLTWATSLILQATESGSIAMTAACMAGVLALLFAQRWVDIYQRGR